MTMGRRGWSGSLRAPLEGSSSFPFVFVFMFRVYSILCSVFCAPDACCTVHASPHPVVGQSALPTRSLAYRLYITLIVRPPLHSLGSFSISAYTYGNTPHSLVYHPQSHLHTCLPCPALLTQLPSAHFPITSSVFFHHHHSLIASQLPIITRRPRRKL